MIKYIDHWLKQLRAIISRYKGQQSLENRLASEIIDLKIKRIKHLQSHPTPVSHPCYIQDQQSMLVTFSERFRQLQYPRAYWQLGQPVGAPVTFICQIQYLPLPAAVPDLDQAISWASIDFNRDLHEQINKFGGAVKVWITSHVK